MSRTWLPAFLRSTTRTPIRHSTLTLALQTLEAREVPAAVNYTGGTYTQDFDSLPTTGAIVWANDSTIPAWSLFRQPAPGTALTAVATDTGSGTAGTYSNFGVAGTNALTDRAIGSLGSGGTYWGSPASGAVAGWSAVAIQNNTGGPVSTVTYNYDGEQWRNNGNATKQTMVSEYGFGATFGAVTWIASGASFNFTSPIASATASALDGNAPANRVAGVGGTLNGLSWNSGDTLWIRWIENNDTGNDHALAVDNFTFTTPAGNTATTTAFPGDGVAPTTVNLGSPVTFKATVTSTGTPTLGTVEFRNGSASGTLLATADGTGSTTTATTRNFVVTASNVPAGTYSNVNAYYIPGTGFNSSNTPAAFGTPLTVVAFTPTIAIVPDAVNPAAGTTINYTLTFGSSNGVPSGTYDYYANGLKLNATTLTIPGSGTAMFSIGTNAIQVGTNDKLTPGINDIEVRVTGTGLFLNKNESYGQRVQANPFGSGNILVLRNNDGYNAPSVNGNRTYIDEFLAGATNQANPVQSLILPTLAVGANKPVLTSGQQSTDTQMVLSPDGKFAYFTAYNALPNNTQQLHTTAATIIPRVVGRLTLADGTIETSMALTDVASGGVFRGLAVTATGEIYATGATGGIRYIPGGYNAATTTSTDLGSTINFTNLTIAGSTPQLYAATPNNGVAATNPKVALIGGPGLPTTGTPTVTSLLTPAELAAGITPRNPESVFFADLDATVSYAGGIDTMYVSEYGTTNLFSGGSVTKWTWKDPGSGFQWIVTGTIAAPAGQPNVDNNFTHLSGRQTGGSVDLVISNGGGGNNGGGAVWTVTDSKGYDNGFTTTSLDLLATVAESSNKAFRSAVKLPGGAVAPTVSSFTVNGNNPQRSRIVSIELTFSGPVSAVDFNTLGAIQLKRTAVAAPPTGAVNDIVQTGPAAANHITVAQNGANGLVLTFDNNGSFQSVNTGVENGSLSDGYWQIIQGTYTSTLNDLALRRLYGDSTVSAGGLVDGADGIAFGNDFNSNLPAFDFNNDGIIDGGDGTAFGNRFGNSL